MHGSTDFDVSAEFIVGGIATVFSTLIGFALRAFKHNIDERARILEANQERNTAKIECLREKVTEQAAKIEVLDKIAIKKDDLDECLNYLRENLETNIRESFKIVHDRIDGIYKK